MQKSVLENCQLAKINFLNRSPAPEHRDNVNQQKSLSIEHPRWECSANFIAESVTEGDGVWCLHRIFLILTLYLRIQVAHHKTPFADLYPFGFALIAQVKPFRASGVEPATWRRGHRRWYFTFQEDPVSFSRKR